MSSIDERIVDMQFNNKQFEEGIQTSLKSLNNLSKSLDSTDNINALSGIQSGIQTVANRFTALGVIATTTLVNLTNSAINAGTQFVKSFTLDPITMGFKEYETQINAVQTILANTSSKGTTLQQVNAALDELNTYADKTIYNFTEMTRNIGTFTAAGVDLDISVQAIKGIANLAAVSGSNAQQASTAMYQLSQALASGTVKLMDWNSVVNAGMGGQVFQDALKETARVHGVAIDQMIESEGSFRETLADGWLTSDILLETLNKFTGDMSEAQLRQLGYTEEQISEIIKLGKMANAAATEVKTLTQLFDTLSEAAQSGWTQSWEIIMGDFGEAKDLLTDISNTMSGIIGQSADNRNNLLRGGLSSGWKQFLAQGISDEAGYKASIAEVAKAHNQSLDDMIAKEGSFENVLKSGWLTADMMSASLENLTAKTRGLSDEQLDELGYTREQITALETLNESVKDGSVSIDEFADKITKVSGRENLIQALWNAFEGLISVIKPINEAFRDIFPPMTGDQLYALTAGIATLTEKFKIGDDTANNLKRTFAGLFSIIDIGKQLITAIASNVLDLVGAILPCTGGLLAFTAVIGDFIVGIDDALKTSDVFNKTFGAIGTGIKNVVNAIKNDLKGMFETPAFQKLDNMLQSTEKILIASIEKIGNILSEFGNMDFGMITDIINNLADNIKPFTLFGTILSGTLSTIYTIMYKVGTLFSSLANIFGASFKSLSDAISQTFSNDGLVGVLDVINGGLFATILLGIKSFIDGLSDITSNAGNFLEGITDILDGVKNSLEAYQSSLKAKTLITIASSIAILAAALTVLSLIDSARLMTAIGAISVLFVELSASMQILSKSAGVKGITTLSTSMIAISTAILILSAAMEKLAGIDWDGITKGAIAIGILLTELKLFVNSVHGEKLISTSIAMIAIGAAMNIFVTAVKGFGELDIATIVKGVATLGVVLGELSIFINLIQPTKLMSTSIAIIAIGGAMLIFAEAIGKMGALSLTEIGKGLLTMAGTLTILTAAIDMLPKNIMSKSTSLLVLSTSLTILANVMSNLGDMTWNEIAKSLITLAGSLTIITIAMQAMTGGLAGASAMMIMSMALTSLIPALKIVSSMQITEIGIALLALVGVFTVLGVAGLVLAPIAPIILVLAAAIALLGIAASTAGIGLTACATGLTALSLAGASADLLDGIGLTALSVGIAAITAAIVAAVTGLLSLIPIFAIKIGEGIIAFAKVIADGVPVIMVAIKALVEGLITIVGELMPKVIETLFEFIDKMLDKLVEYAPKFVDSGIKLLISLLEGLSENISDIVEIAVTIITLFIEAIGKEAPRLIDSGVKMIIDFINGLAEAIRQRTPELIEAVVNLAGAIIEGLTGGLIKGIVSVVETIKNVGKALINGFKEILGIHSPSKIFTDLAKNIIDGLVNGLTNGISTVIKKAEDIGSSVINTVREKFKEIDDVAKYIITGLSNGLTNGISVVSEAAKKVASSALDSAKKFLDIHSPSRRFEKEVGENTALGMAEGMDNRTDKVAKSAKKMAKTAYDNAVLWIKNYQNDTEYLVSEELAMWETLAKKYQYVSKEKVEIDKNVLALRKKMDKESFDESKKWIEEKKKLEELSIAEEVEAWERVQARYAKGTEARKEADQALFDARKRLLKESFEVSKKWIEEKKNLEELSLLEEIAAWERVQARYAEGTEYRKEADQALFDAKKRLLAEEEKLLQAREDAEQRYTDALENRTKTIVNSFGLFEELKEQEKVSSTVLRQNLQDQVDEMRNWAENLAELAKRGIDDGLLYELQQMGPDANAQIAALVRMTDAQLTDYQLLWKEKSEIARQQAIGELEGLRKDVNEEVANINNELKKLGYMDPENFAELGKESINALVSGYKEKEPEAILTVSKISEAVVSELTDNIPAYSKVAGSLMLGVAKGFGDKKTDVVNTASDITTTSSGQMSNSANDYYYAGANVIAGFIDGMRSKMHEASYTSAMIANDAYMSAKNELDIHSPSRKFESIGKYSIEGLIVGLKNMMGSVKTVATEVGDSAITGLSNAMNSIGDVITGDMDFSPTIRPVFDMSNIQNGMGQLDKMLSSNRTIDLDLANVRATSSTMARQQSSGDQISSNSTSSVTINNNFDCTGMTVRNDSDISAISSQLYQRQQAAMRGRGNRGYI